MLPRFSHHRSLFSTTRMRSTPDHGLRCTADANKKPHPSFRIMTSRTLIGAADAVLKCVIFNDHVTLSDLAKQSMIRSVAVSLRQLSFLFTVSGVCHHVFSVFNCDRVYSFCTSYKLSVNISTRGGAVA